MSVIDQVAALDLTNMFGAGGLFDLASNKINTAMTVVRAFASLAAIGFVVWRGIKTSGAFGAIVIAGLCAGAFVWIVFNVTEIKNRVGSEVTSAAVFDSSVLQSPMTWLGDRQ